MGYDIDSVMQAQRIIELEKILAKSRIIIMESISLFEREPDVYNVDSVRKFISRVDDCLGCKDGRK